MTITVFTEKPQTPPVPICTGCTARLGYEAKSLAELGTILLCDRCLFRYALERAQQLYGADAVPSAERAVSA